MITELYVYSHDKVKKKLSFFSPKLVAIPRLMSPVYPTILPRVGRGKKRNGFMSHPQDVAKVKCKQPLIWTWIKKSILYVDNHYAVCQVICR